MSHRMLGCVLAAHLSMCIGVRPAVAKVRIVATVPSLGALAQAIGGADVDVQVLAAPTQDPHFVDGRPSFIVALNRADLLVYVGLGLEAGWLPALLQNARNPRILTGSPGHLDASTVAGPILEAGGRDRAMGDVHPGGNPHYLVDPRYGANVAAAIATRLAQLDPERAATYRANAVRVRGALARHVADWQRRMAAHRGKPVVAYHRSVVYLCRWLGLKRAGYVEPLPGVPPSPSHLAQLILQMRKSGVKVVVSEPWYDAETARVVASKAGATVVRLPGDVGAPGIRSYEDVIEHLVSGLEKAL